MGMAYQAPPTRREFRYQITKHAIDRFRERVEEEFVHRDDIDLARLLDDRLRAAVDGGNYTDIKDPSTPTGEARVVRIESRVGTTQHVVLRPDKGVASGYAAITLVTDAQARNSYATGKWTIPNRPFAEALRNIKPAEAKPEEPAPVREASIVRIGRPPGPVSQRKPPEGARSREQKQARIDYINQVLVERPHITWRGPDGIQDMLIKEFGIGITCGEFTKLRAARIAAMVAQPAVAMPPPAPRPSNGATVAALAADLARCVAAEKEAVERHRKAQAELWEAEAAAKRAAEATEGVMRKLQQERGQ